MGNGGGEIFLCVDGQGPRADAPDAGAWMGWFLTAPADVDEAHALAVRAGVTVAQPPTDFPWNMRECAWSGWSGGWRPCWWT